MQHAEVETALAEVANSGPAVNAPILRPMAFAEALELTTSRHGRLCPRQVLGVRIGFAGTAALGLAVSDANRRLLVFVETDGCFADGIEAATGCSMGHRTLRLEDYGKVAATFVDSRGGKAVRVAPAPGIRQLANEYEPSLKRYEAQLRAYQGMPERELLTIVPVQLNRDIASIIGRNGVRLDCQGCGEEIINQREVHVGAATFCIACARAAYYSPAPESHVELHVEPVQVPIGV